MSAALVTPALIALFAALAVASIVLLAGLGVRHRLIARARLRAATRRGPEPGRRSSLARRDDNAPAQGLLRIAMQGLRLVGNRQVEAIRLRLAQAGWRTPAALNRYLAAKLTLPFALGAYAASMAYGGGFGDLDGVQKALAVVVAALAGSFVPELVVRNQRDKRREALRLAVPDTLDLLVICAEAGLSIDPALDRIAREIAPGAPEMADELRQTVNELRYLPERRRAWDNLNQRADLPQLRAVVNALIQTERYGTSLAQFLRILSQEQRAERTLRAEEKAARLPAVMTLPLILLILPALFLIVMGPAAIDIMESLKNY